jgi:hypothetical protein
MKRAAFLLAAFLVACSTALPARAQDMGGSIETGTLGFGARFAVSVGRQVVLRTGAAFEPFAIRIDESDVAYDLDLPDPSFSALLDWHPGSHAFRLSGGVFYFTNDLKLKGTPDRPVEIGDHEYESSQIGTLVGDLGTRRFAPYVGIGVGNSTRLGTTFALDFGLAFHGTPDAHLRATGPIRDDATFQADLDQELQDVNHDIERFKAYPVLTLGIGFGI